nr:retrovirus-related Pol polyprotein from transposon TNT 1-94 [Tanacetum cinerariifolium]
MSDLDTMSLDDLYNHLKVYESEVQKKSETNSQNMDFISSAKHIRGNEEVNTASVSTASTNVPTASANIGVVSISQDTACAYIASQSSGSQIKFEDINQIDEDDMEEIDIKWNMALLSMRADRECKAPKTQDRGRRDNYRQGSKVKEQAPKALMAIDGVGWDWSYMANDEENHALVADEEAPTEFALMAKTSAEIEVFDNSLCSKDCKKYTDSLNSKITDLTNKPFDDKKKIYLYKLGLAQVESRLAEHIDREIKYYKKIRGLEFKIKSSDDYIESLKKELELIKKEKEGLDSKLTGFQTASKDLDNLLESQRLDTKKEGFRYSVVPPPPGQIYSPPKKDMPAPTVESSPDNAQNRNPSDTETEASPSTISPKSFIKFVKANDSPTKSKTEKAEKAKKPPVRYAEQYKKPTKKLNVRGNQRNWNNLKSHQLGPNFVMKKNACFNCGDFNHFAYDCSKRVKNGTSRSQNTNHKSFTPRPDVHKPYRPPMRPMRSNMNGARPNRTSFNKLAYLYTNRPFQRTSVGSSQNNIDDKGNWDSGYSRHMTGNISYLSDYEPFDGVYVSFGQGGCKITDKGTIKTVTDDFSRFTWTLFIKAKDETSGILRKFITKIENLKDLKVKIIMCDNGGKFINKEMNDFCSQKGIKREFSNARTPQQNGVVERRNRTSIEAARTMLADAKLPVTFWAEAVNTTCYVQNKVLVNKSHNKTPYELFNGRSPAIGFLKPFGYHVIILNTLDNLGKFEAKGDEGYFIGYSMSRKSFRVFNKRTRRVEENLHVEFLENKAIEKGAGPNWLFHIYSLTKSMNYVPVVVGTNSTNFLGTKDAASQEVKKDVSSLRYMALPNWVHDAILEPSLSKPQDDCSTDVPERIGNSNPTATSTNPPADQLETLTLETPIPTVSSLFEDILGVTANLVDSDGVEANVSNMETNITDIPTLTLRIHKDHPKNLQRLNFAEFLLFHKVIKFGDSYEVPASAATIETTSDGTGKKTGRTVTLTAKDMQKRKNDVKARTTLLLSLPDEHQLRFTKHSRGNEDVNTASVSTASTNVPTGSANIGIDEDDIEKMDIKWNMALLSMRTDKFWKKAGKKISIQGSDVVGFDKLKVECCNCHKMGHFARECRAPRSLDRGRRDNYRQ